MNNQKAKKISSAEELDYVLNAIEERLITDGLAYTTEGSYIATHEDFSDLISEEDYKEHFGKIIDRIEAREEILDVDISNGEIDIMFGLDYIPFVVNSGEIDLDELALLLDDGNYFHIQTCDDGWDYTLYDKNFREIDGGQLDNPELDIHEATKDILMSFDYSEVKGREFSLDELYEKVDAVETAQWQSLQEKIQNAKMRAEYPIKQAQHQPDRVFPVR